MNNTMDGNMEHNDSPEIENPFDSVISRIESYIQNPKLVTPETLAQLKEEVIGLKEGVEGEDAPSEDSEGSSSGDKPSLALTIGMMGKKGGYR